MLGTAKEEIKLSDDLWGNSDLKAIRNQMDEDFKYWGPYDFQMDSAEGKWRNVTTPSGKTLGNKIKGLLQQSYMNLHIDVVEEEREKNKKIADTEKLALGFIYRANRNNTKRPSGVTLQDGFSWYAPVHAGTACSFLLTEDDGDITPHITSYDPYGCQYIEGDDGIVWFCYRENKKADYLKRIYKKQIDDGFRLGKVDKGLITVYTFWDTEEWKVAINGEYVPDEGDTHNLGYVPLFINPVGGVPPIMSEEEDISKYAWQSVFVNNRALIPLESELLSIELTKAKESGRVKGIASYDSSLTDGQVPEEINKLKAMRDAAPTRDTMAFLDKAKGEEFHGFVEAPDNRIVDQLLKTVVAYNSLSSIDPVTYGAFRGEGSGALANILRDSALEFMHPFSKNIEDTFVWIAEESVRQFKNGNYPRVEVVGRDINREPFSEKIKPEDVEEHYFSCELVSDRLRDEAIELGLAIQKVKAGLSDKKSAISRHNLAANPDRTLEMIQQEIHAEMAAKDPVHHNLGMAEWHKNQMTGDKEKDAVHEQMAAYHKLLADGAAQIAVQSLAVQINRLFNPEQGEVPPGAEGVPEVTAEAGRVAAEPTTDENNSIRQEMTG